MKLFQNKSFAFFYNVQQKTWGNFFISVYRYNHNGCTELQYVSSGKWSSCPTRWYGYQWSAFCHATLGTLDWSKVEEIKPNLFWRRDVRIWNALSYLAQISLYPSTNTTHGCCPSGLCWNGERWYNLWCLLTLVLSVQMWVLSINLWYQYTSKVEATKPN